MPEQETRGHLRFPRGFSLPEVRHYSNDTLVSFPFDRSFFVGRRGRMADRMARRHF